MSNRSYQRFHCLDVSESDSQMEVFQKLPRIAIPLWLQFLSIIPPILIMVGMIFTMSLVGAAHRLIELSIVIFFAILSLWSYPVSRRFISAYFESEQAKEDYCTFNASPSERHVGIAYCDYFWIFRSDTSWDRGFLSYNLGFMNFRGLGPNFSLPVSAIEEVWISVSGFGLWQTPRLFIRWNHPESGLNTISFQIRTEKTKSACFEKTRELESWLNSLPRDKVSDSFEAIWPFQSSCLDFAKLPSRQFVEKKDIWVAGTWGICIFFSFELVSFIVHHFTKWDTSFFNTMGTMIGFIAYRDIVRNRVVAKGKS